MCEIRLQSFREAGLAWPVAAVLCVVVVMAPSIISGMASRRVWRALDTRARSMPRGEGGGARDHNDDELRWWWVEENRGGGGGGRCQIEDMQRGVPATNAPFYDEEDDDDAVKHDNDDSVEFSSGDDGDRRGRRNGMVVGGGWWGGDSSVIRMRKKKGGGGGILHTHTHLPHPQRWV